MRGVTLSDSRALANRHSWTSSSTDVGVNHYCQFFFLNITFLQLYSSDLLFYGSTVVGRFFTACFKFWLNHILEVSATLCIMRKVCSGSLHVMRIPLYAKKFEARTSPCLSPGALATPNSRFSQVHATERAVGWGVIWGYFHIFTIFRPDLLKYLEQH